MRFDDEVRARSAKMQADMNTEAQRRRQEVEIDIALKEAGFTRESSKVELPPEELRPVIMEALPHLKFTKPKIVRTIGGVTYARYATTTIVKNKQQQETPDEVAFDVILYEGRPDDAGLRTCTVLSIFPNGRVSASLPVAGKTSAADLLDRNYRSSHGGPITPEFLRQKILDTMAKLSIAETSAKAAAKAAEPAPTLWGKLFGKKESD